MATAATANYKRILNLLEKWPLDKSKQGRDFGKFLRETVDKAYKQHQFEENFQYWDTQYLSLQKLVNNEHKKRYQRSLPSSASGLTAEQCNIALSNDFLEELKKEEEPMIRKFFKLKKSE